MSLEIDATAETLMRQAGYTAEEYMRAAVTNIDRTFGKGYGKENPLLIAAFMLAAALDYQAASDLAGSQKIAEAIDRFEDTFAVKIQFYEDYLTEMGLVKE